mmetsp:Transcript_21190/g.38368  ORF Transcript_21190/g.38368 Transcript_21190/m.38368 type:complete len:223 (+) Transcript_21190:81-749(+)|eukprot:CAMPEP_0201867368 /NCGR_PEP_ID=MMETSP0902-20130614/1618_1 /ASSEMBLY_ACC=CAM_ASM_000551 /TAXON_ID=420261 /ORGANISM="Thalassiosira antarctica, Strain CCMP982" /LENGTH=222 /DNA_ID=CAMNT_0048392511 /DNA_START=40 /DNA_END=708 /DNA_ORIENTATION=+
MHTTNLLVAIAALSSVGLLASAERPTKKLRTKRKTQKNKDGGNGNIMDEEDIVFWTRLLQGGDTDRGKETEFMSMPTVPRPPAGGGPVLPSDRTTRPTRNPTRPPTPAVTPDPTSPPVTTPTPPSPATPDPTRRPTPDPTRRPTPPPVTPPTPTPPTPTPPTFNCPPASFVGCTATDPSDAQDECEPVGEPCSNGIAGEFCCRDACPRNYCTAKEALPGTRE